MKFLCDQMLGTLAKWMRLLGFDTFYATNTLTDDELLAIAQEEKRVLITRDKELCVRAKKRCLDVIEMKTIDLDEQLFQVVSQHPIDNEKILSRCTLCNTILDDVEKIDVADKVPERIFENNTRFWFCSHCHKYYWQGSHYEAIVQKIDDLQKNRKK